MPANVGFSARRTRPSAAPIPNAAPRPSSTSTQSVARSPGRGPVNRKDLAAQRLGRPSSQGEFLAQQGKDLAAQRLGRPSSQGELLAQQGQDLAAQRLGRPSSQGEFLAQQGKDLAAQRLGRPSSQGELLAQQGQDLAAQRLGRPLSQGEFLAQQGKDLAAQRLGRPSNQGELLAQQGQDLAAQRLGRPLNQGELLAQQGHLGNAINSDLMRSPTDIANDPTRNAALSLRGNTIAAGTAPKTAPYGGIDLSKLRFNTNASDARERTMQELNQASRRTSTLGGLIVKSNLGNAINSDLMRSPTDIANDPTRNAALSLRGNTIAAGTAPKTAPYGGIDLSKLRFNTNASDARERTMQELNQAGIIRDGSRIDAFGKFDAGVLQGQADIDARAFDRNLAERRAGMGQGLQFSQQGQQDRQFDASLGDQNTARQFAGLQGQLERGFAGSQAGFDRTLTQEQLAQQQKQFQAGQNLSREQLSGTVNTIRGPQDTLAAQQLAQQQKQFQGGQNLAREQLSGTISTMRGPQDSLASQQLAQQNQQFTDQLAQQQRQFQGGQNLAREQLSGTVNTMRGPQDTLAAQQLSQQSDQFGRGLVEQGRQFDDTLSRGINQDARTNQLALLGLSEAGGQFNRGLAEQERQFDAGQTFTGSQNAANRGLQAAIEGGRLGQQQSQLGEQGRQFDASLGESQAARIAANNQAGLDRGTSLALQNNQLGFNREQLAQQQGQFTTGADEQERQFNQNNVLRQQELFGGVQGIGLNDLGSAGALIQRVTSGQGTPADTQGFLEAASQLQDLTAQRLGRPLNQGELEALLGGQSVGGRQTLGAQQFDRSLADQNAARQFAGRQGQLERGFAGSQAGFDRALEQDRLDQQQGQFQAGQNLSREQLSGTVNTIRGPQDTLAAQQLAQQDRQFDRSLTDQGAARQFAGLQGRQERSFLASQAGYDRALEQDRLDQQQGQFQAGQNLSREQLSGTVNTIRGPQDTLAAQQLAQQGSQFDRSLADQNTARQFAGRQGQLERGFAGSQAGLDRRQQGDQFDRSLIDQGAARQFVGRQAGLDRMQQGIGRNLQASQFDRSLADQDLARQFVGEQAAFDRTQQGDQFDLSFEAQEDQRGVENRQLRAAMGMEADEAGFFNNNQPARDQIREQLLSEILGKNNYSQSPPPRTGLDNDLLLDRFLQDPPPNTPSPTDYAGMFAGTPVTPAMQALADNLKAGGSGVLGAASNASGSGNPMADAHVAAQTGTVTQNELGLSQQQQAQRQFDLDLRLNRITRLPEGGYMNITTRERVRRP